MIHFTTSVGVAPGTTTMQMGIPSIAPLNGLGVCPPGHYGIAVMLPGTQTAPTTAALVPGAEVPTNPYGTESKLQGLGRHHPVRYDPGIFYGLGETKIRYDLFALAAGVAFAGWLGYALLKKRYKKRG